MYMMTIIGLENVVIVLLENLCEGKPKKKVYSFSFVCVDDARAIVDRVFQC